MAGKRKFGTFARRLQESFDDTGARGSSPTNTQRAMSRHEDSPKETEPASALASPAAIPLSPHRARQPSPQKVDSGRASKPATAREQAKPEDKVSRVGESLVNASSLFSTKAGCRSGEEKAAGPASSKVDGAAPQTTTRSGVMDGKLVSVGGGPGEPPEHEQERISASSKDTVHGRASQAVFDGCASEPVFGGVVVVSSGKRELPERSEDEYRKPRTKHQRRKLGSGTGGTVELRSVLPEGRLVAVKFANSGTDLCRETDIAAFFLEPPSPERVDPSVLHRK